MTDLEKEVEVLKEQIQDKLNELSDSKFSSTAATEINGLTKKFNDKRELKGHFMKVYAVHWAGRNSDLIISASQDAKVIVWNAETENKVNAITLQDQWVMTCAFEQENNQRIATGGLRNICYIYQQREYDPSQTVTPALAELTGHEGYVSCCRFVDENTIVTSSGDGSCQMWDISQNKATHLFQGHMQDVMSISPNPNNPKIFVSGSIDLECKLWDVRVQGSVATMTQKPQENMFVWDEEPEFSGETIGARMFYKKHESDINSVAYFPDGFAFGSGSDDQTCRLWDTRCHQQVNVFKYSEIVTGVNQIDFSKSGRILFAGYDDCNLFGWDTLANPGENDESVPVFGRKHHAKKVSAVSVHTGGKAVATGSWDTLVKIYA